MNMILNIVPDALSQNLDDDDHVLVGSFICVLFQNSDVDDNILCLLMISYSVFFFFFSALVPNVKQ